MTPGLNPLRHYQLDVVRAVADSIVNQRGDSFAVEFARQAGKNELSAQLELTVLTVLAEQLHIAPSIIKVAPTDKPQARISRHRLRTVAKQAGIRSSQSESIVSPGHGTATFLSAQPEADISGQTADPLLEVDEAQDVDADKFDKDVKPFGASTNATTVFYGTAWSETDLLHMARLTAIADQERDGRQRSFIVPWTVLARLSALYKRFVEVERDRLGPRHVMFTTQYLMEPVPGGGRLLSPHLLAMRQGQHDRQHTPPATALTAAGLDVGGGEGISADPDLTVLSLGSVTTPSTADAPGNYTAVMHHVAWQGLPHDQLLPAIIDVCRSWRVTRIAIDATGLGQTIGRLVATALGDHIVDLVKFTRPVKSQLAFDLQSSIGTGRFKMYANDGSTDYSESTNQAKLCRQDLLPGNYIDWYVPTNEGHDDYIVSEALLNQATAHVEDRSVRVRR